jgi:hypothetical protein
MADQIRVNGNLQSWGSIVLKIDGDPYTGFNAIDFSDKRERAFGYGMGRHQAPRGRTRGKYSADNAKLGGPVGSIAMLRAALAAKAEDGKSYGNVEFQVIVQYVELDDTPVQIELDRCCIVGDGSSHKEGAEQLENELELSVFVIRRNELTLFDQTQGAPA